LTLGPFKGLLWCILAIITGIFILWIIGKIITFIFKCVPTYNSDQCWTWPMCTCDNPCTELCRGNFKNLKDIIEANNLDTIYEDRQSRSAINQIAQKIKDNILFRKLIDQHPELLPEIIAVNS